jgi:hypothetical protein
MRSRIKPKEAGAVLIVGFLDHILLIKIEETEEG